MMSNFVFLYYGLLAMLAQLVVFRELSVLFYGNELFLGTFLSSWLFWVGLGSLLVRRLLKKEHTATLYFSYGFLTMGLLFPAVILFIRVSKGLFAFGEFIGPVVTVLYTFSVMSALCFVIGGQFSLACVVAFKPNKKETAVGRVYLCEALGAVLGGVAFTYFLIGSVPTFTIALMLSLGCVFLSLGLWGKEISRGSLGLVAVALALLFVSSMAEPVVNRVEWKKYQLIKQKETRNATLSLVTMGSLKNIFADGILSGSFPDPESYEPVAHWPLLATARPERILILGEASLGVIKEALRHNPKRVDYVVSDHSWIDFVRPYLEREELSALKDPVVRLHEADLRAFVRCNKNKYDAVIMNLPEVPNLKTNRFYTGEFCGLVKSILKPNGIWALNVVSSENYLSAETRRFNASVYLTLKSVFKDVEVIPGERLMFLAGPATIDLRKETILGHFRERRISGHYVTPSYLEYKLETPRRVELKELLEGTPGVRLNRDFRPTTCYYFAGFWLNKFASPLGALGAGVLSMAIAFWIYKKKKSLLFLAGQKELVILLVLGFVGLSLELVLLLGYQIISGDVYWQMGILFASFMSGLFLGSLFGNGFKDNARQGHFMFLVILSLMITGLSAGAARLLPSFIYLSTGQNLLIFMTLLALVGAMVGAAFVIASFLVRGDAVMARAGGLYAADLWGSALGAILSTNLIVPLFGILGALNFSAVMGLSGSVLWLMKSGKVR